MQTVIVTGSSGLIGSESVKFFSNLGFRVVGIDNDMRKYFFGNDASTSRNKDILLEQISDYKHYDIDIRNYEEIEKIFTLYGSEINLIIHTAAQPSHDWAAKEPFTDFTVNANGTLNLLESTRRHCPHSVFIFTSTNKVYGDRPNYLPLVEGLSRWNIDQSHPYFEFGIDENMSIDQTKHSLFGSSKVSADILVQEYGKYFNMKTVCFRGGCLTGPGHSGTMLHGFLSYLMKCAVSKNEYSILGYKGKQVRDNIHSYDLVSAFYEFYKNPKIGEVYNIGGGVYSNCSILEGIRLCEKITGNKMVVNYEDENRIGDHIWWISDVRKFQNDYPDWQYKYNLEDTLLEIYNNLIV